MSKEREPSSFRDPSGFVYRTDGVLYRQLDIIEKKNYGELMLSGLYNDLTNRGFLIPHTEVSTELAHTRGAHKVLKPEIIPFISYPYEWSFSQLKDAALLTLKIQKMAFAHGMSLKDASAYNIQFRGASPILIDTLSFETYKEDAPWVAYRQFCQHFLAPLALMAHTDIRLGELLKSHLDGIPLDLASTLLPLHTHAKSGMLMHIHLHAKAQKKYATTGTQGKNLTFSRIAFQGLIDSLSSAITSLHLKKSDTEWGDYYNDTNYSADAFEHKKELVTRYLEKSQPQSVWDIGANNGEFSRIASEKDIQTVSMDIDPLAVEKNYLRAQKEKSSNLLPLLIDFTNPSAAIGWSNQERKSLPERGHADTILALALVHHLALSNNIPLDIIAEGFSELSRYLIIEFIPKSDSQVQRLLSSREDIFPYYTQKDFEETFRGRFEILESMPIDDSERILYYMRRL